MGLSDVVYGVYERRLSAQIPPERRPRHVGVILDGNRRWASEQGATSSAGHRAGAAKIVEFLGWCDEAGVEVVTLWLLSTDNLNRPPAELEPLLGIIEDTVADLVAQGRWRLHPVGALDLLPAHTSRVLKEAEEATSTISGSLVNVAVGYGGRREVVDAVRQSGVKAVYREPEFDAAVLDTIGKETGARVLTLYSIYAGPVNDYPALMRANAAALVDGLAR